MEEKVKQTTKTKKPLKFEDSVIVNVQSAVHGTLIYINHKSGDQYLWPSYGDVQQLNMYDLRAMKAGQIAFYANNWINILGSDSPGYENATPADFYNALFVGKYYNIDIDLSDIRSVFAWSVEDINAKVPGLSAAIKENLIVALNDAVNSGAIDSVKKIKALEAALNCTVDKSNG